VAGPSTGYDWVDEQWAVRAQTPVATSVRNPFEEEMNANRVMNSPVYQRLVDRMVGWL